MPFPQQKGIPMKRITLMGALTLLVLLASATVASAADVQLTSVLYPERKSIDVPFAVTEIGPAAAKVTAEVEFKNGQSQIEISYKEMQPAIMFAGDITTYSVWAITKDGVFENLGALNVVDPKGSQKFSTGQRDFAMMITAEPVSGVAQVSTLVVLKSGMPNKPEAKATPFTFNRFGNAVYQGLVLPGNPSIKTLKFIPGGEPIELMKARKLVELGGSIKLDPGAVDELQRREDGARAGAELDRQGGQQQRRQGLRLPRRDARRRGDPPHAPARIMRGSSPTRPPARPPRRPRSRPASL